MTSKKELDNKKGVLKLCKVENHTRSIKTETRMQKVVKWLEIGLRGMKKKK
jgi:hypothetical protein